MSLFDTIMADVGEGNAGVNDAPVNGGNESSQSSEPSWWWDKSTPGQGDRPDWLPSQFKSAEDAARSYAELSKKIGTAPDKYDWSKGQGWLDPEYAPFEELGAFAKSKHVSQDVIDKMVETVGKYLDEFNINYDEERSLLGENAEERLRVLDSWTKANFSEETYNALTSNMKTASAVKAIEEMRTKMIENNTNIPTGNESSAPSYSLEDVQREMQENLQKWKDDPKYRKEIQAKMTSVASQSRFIDKNY